MTRVSSCDADWRNEQSQRRRSAHPHPTHRRLSETEKSHVCSAVWPDDKPVPVKLTRAQGADASYGERVAVLHAQRVALGVGLG